MFYCRVLFFFTLFTSVTFAQQTAPPQAAPPPATGTAKPDTHLSPAEAEELFKSVDDVMQFASQDSGLPIKSKVKREMGTRDQVEKYIQDKMEDDEDTKRFERTELVLKKFGMLPVDFQLKPFLIKLLREQVAGFYDAKTKTMHLLDWLPADAQRPVMAHELTHALQDQAVDLDTWIGKLTDNSKKAADPVNAEIENDEDSTARSALTEGQGTAVMVDYMLVPVGKSVESSPELVEMMKGAMSDTKDMPTLAAAPILLKESLTFPYREGLGFVQALLKAGGKKLAYADALRDPPHDTHLILHPDEYLAHKTTPVMHMPDLTAILGKNYEKYDVGSIGEFDLMMLFKTFKDGAALKVLAPKWQGGMYYAAAKHTGRSVGVGTQSAVGPATPDQLVLLYVSRWPSAEDARAFAAAYSQTVVKRYANAFRKDCAGVPDCSMWNIVNNDPVMVQAVGSQVFVSENFDQKTADALRKLIFADSSVPAKAAHVVPAGNLSMRVPRFFAALAAAH